MASLSSSLAGAPPWVWPFLAFLIFVGIKATRPRTVLAWPIYILPLLGGFAVNAVNGLSPNMTTWAAFFLGYIAGIIFGYWLQAGIVIEHFGAKVSLRGEWITLAVLMAVFWLNFMSGAVSAIAPEIHNSDLFHMTFAGIAGFASGSFLGRALKTYRLRQSS